MFLARMSRWSLRLEQAEVSRLAWAFAISLAFHLLIYGSYHTGNKYHIWHHLHLPAWVHAPKFLTELIKPKQSLVPPRRREDTPLIFVNVSPAQATAEPPKEAKYYSDKNARAANPEADKITDTPKIDGKQTEVVKTEDVPRKEFTPLQRTPSPPPPKETQPPPPQPPKETKPPPPEPPKEAQAEAKPKPADKTGDLTLAKPSPTPHEETGDANEAKPPRPRTIREALLRQQDSRLPGEKIRQDGGVRHRQPVPSLDTRATPFGAYDAALVDAIAGRWYSLLDERDYASDSRGKVVLQFALHYDGRVTDMNMPENTAGEVLGFICQKAVLDNNPFAAWPSDMRRTLGDIRNIQFTFYYY